MLFAVVLAVFIFWWILPLRSGNVTRDEFEKRGAHYHMQIALACDDLLRTAPGGTSHYSGTNHVLPLILRDLGAYSVHISKPRYEGNTSEQHSYVFITMGQSRLGYGILWSPDDLTPDGPKWRLSVADEGGSVVLFVRIAPSHTNELANPITQ